MKANFYPLKLLFCAALLCSMNAGVLAQQLDLSKTVRNATAGTNGTTAIQHDMLEYTISVKNLSTSNCTSVRLYDNIPAGVSYVSGSATLNGVSVADVSGKMPFANTGGLINSPLYGAGILAPHAAATITFQVRVTANGGNITNYGTAETTYNGATLIQNTNTVFTNLSPDPLCSVIYQVTGNSTGASLPYKYFRTMDATTGAGSSNFYNGTNGPCYNALTGATLPNGSLISSGSGVAAIAYEKTKNRIYFVNNTASSPQDLGYIDLNASPVCARSFVGYPLEINTSSGFNINRMAFASDGSGYAVTSNGEDLIQFTIDPVTDIPTINRLGPLINDVNNGSNDILDEAGGDIFGDGSGKLYMIANSSKLYKINPATRIATYLGSINPFPGTSQAIALDAAGNVYIGGAYQNVYKINLVTMAATSIVTSGTNVYTTGDYTSCAFPVLASAITANKTYRNLRGSAFVVGGDTVEYRIETTNTGNINAAGVKLYDYIPAATTYVPNSTKLNGIPVPDVGGLMPFSVGDGLLINSAGEAAGIIKPGDDYKTVVTFQVSTDPLMEVCNQSKITLLDGDGNSIYVNSHDPAQTGSQAPTCFFSDGTLPLNNLKFTGSLFNDQSVLQWQMNQNANVERFEIEYAENGISFYTIGKLAARNNQTASGGYLFTDAGHLFAAQRYYRLKIVQKGGRVSYSGVIRLQVKGLDVQVLPNPFDQVLNVQLQLKTKETVRIRIVDLQGSEVYKTAELLNAGSHSISFMVPPALARGMYVVEIVAGNNHVYQKKILKK